jgi:serine/threonine-protein kinase HipA
MNDEMNCLLCYTPLTETDTDYHTKCVAKAFGLKQMPGIDIDEREIAAYAKRIVGAATAITGVQPKLSLWLQEGAKQLRFTIVDDRSNYIIKPQSQTYASLPENEDLCMHLAEAFGINTARHGLVRLKTGSLAYITKRFDRQGTNKIACEDLCQLTETLTEHKYRGSHEKTGKAIRQYSTQAGLDALYYFQLVVFSFVTGNADMHLKNFSMLESEDGQFCLSPAYDLVSTMLVINNEDEQVSLSINGRRNKLKKKDFDVLAASLMLTTKQAENCYGSFMKELPSGLWWIENSFLPAAQKNKLSEMLTARVGMFGAA